MTTSLKPLLFAALATAFVTATFAHADGTKPTPPTPPGPPAGMKAPPPPQPSCPTGGAMLFGVLHQYEKTAPDAVTHPTDAFSVNESGAWKLEQTVGTKNSEQGHGCLTSTQLTDIRQQIKKADWHSTQPHVKCMARSNEYTEYTVGGKVMYTQKLCESPVLDADSQKAVDAMNALQTQVTAGTKPPCCKQ